ncbi:SDR family oxidoreductase [Shewanella baltica]|uniref:SDR family oxidoreductase n=1 Tax=Shewanella baltica TaxID=62322 RepID=UPI0030D531F3
MTIQTFTIIGGKGFIGNEIAKKLSLRGHNVFIPQKEDDSLWRNNLGIVIYCAGHGDCINNPLKVLDSNTTLVARLLAEAQFSRFMYISSTRVYMGNETAFEQDDLRVLSNDNRRLFNLTKLVTEELLLRSNKDVVILRPSNVYGVALDSPLFLPAITRNAITTGKIDMYVSPDYAKDYVSVDSVAEMTIAIAIKDVIESKIFNLAAGYNVKASEIAMVLQAETGCIVNWHSVNNTIEIFPETSVSLIQQHIKFYPSDVLDDLQSMITRFSEVMDL